MTQKGYQTAGGKHYWQESTVLYLLTNEKYIGDSLCQKRYTTAFPFDKKRNHGERDKYYVEHTHPAIIKREVFEKAQELRIQKLQRTTTTKGNYPLTLKIVCGVCGSTFARRVSKRGRVSWVCRKHDNRAEEEIYAAFVRMYHKLKRHETDLLKPALAQLSDLKDTLQRGNPAMLAINRAIADTSEQSYKVSILQSKGLLDADACAAKLQDINAKLTELRRERRQLLENEEIEDVVDAVKKTVSVLHDSPETLLHFEEVPFTDLVEKITVETNTRIRFQLYGGISLAEELRRDCE